MRFFKPLLLGVVSCAFETGAAPLDHLHVDSRFVRDSTNRAVILRGVTTITRNNDGKPMTMAAADYDRIKGWGFNFQQIRLEACRMGLLPPCKADPESLAVPAWPQFSGFSKADLIRYTPLNPDERFADGRPKAPEALCKKLESSSSEEVWGALWRDNYRVQFESGWQQTHPEKVLLGRVFTAQYMPARPEILTLVEPDPRTYGKISSSNQRVIDMLQPGDVLVVDLFGKVTVMPGDIAFEGVSFIPPHYLQKVVDLGQSAQLKDQWTRDKMETHKYESRDVYRP